MRPLRGGVQPATAAWQNRNMTRRSLRALMLSAVAIAGLGLSNVTPVATAAPVGVKSYIVQVSKGSNASVEARAKALGGTIGYRYDVALNGFSVTLPVAAVDALSRTPGVTAIEPDGIMTIDATQTSTPSWGLDRIDQRFLPGNSSYTYDTTAPDVVAFIIDTGILASHTDFGARVKPSMGYTAIADGNGTNDCNGHGTHVAGTVGGSTYGVAKGVTLVPIRVLDCSGSGSISGVVAGVDVVTAWATNSANTGIDAVANMSLGGGASSSLDTAVNNAVSAGVVMAVAAGNSNADACTASPARAASALTVGATTSTDARASYSNFGSCLDVFAPGSGITSTWIGSTSATNTISGTSMASPHVAGVAALARQTYPNWTAAEVIAAIKGSATPNVVSSAGTGSPNLLLYNVISSTTSPTPTVTAPGTPQNVSVAAGTQSGTFTARWQAPSDTGGSPITGYRVGVRVEGSTSVTYYSYGASTFSATFRGKSKTTYWVRVAATNSVGTGTASNESSVLTK